MPIVHYTNWHLFPHFPMVQVGVMEIVNGRTISPLTLYFSQEQHLPQNVNSGKKLTQKKTNIVRIIMIKRTFVMVLMLTVNYKARRNAGQI